MKDKLIVLELNEDIFESSKELIKKYCLLPNDALIAASCEHYGIKKIATFDPDFKRVDFSSAIFTGSLSASLFAFARFSRSVFTAITRDFRSRL